MSANEPTRHTLTQVRATLRALRMAFGQRLDRHASVATGLGSVRRFVKRSLFRWRARRADRTLGDPYLRTGRLFLAPVASLQRRTELPYGYDPTRRPGAVVPGDWDRPDWTITGLPYWDEFREALQGRRPWSDTQAFQKMTATATADPVPWRRRVMMADALRVVHGYESLYASMAATGRCLSQHELATTRPAGYRPTNTDDISVGVGRDGELLLCQGGHRVEVARALGIAEVPVWVGVRHPQWWDLRRRLVTYALEHGGRVPEKLFHPDLQDIPYAYDGDSRTTRIRDALSSHAGLVVDLSPAWGYYLHRFEESGSQCLGLCTSDADRSFLSPLRQASQRRFSVVDTVDELTVPAEKRADVLLLLRGASGWLDTAASRESLSLLLARLRPRHIFVELDPPDAAPQTGSGASMIGSGAGMTDSEATAFLLQAARLGEVRRLPAAVGTSGLYHLVETLT